MSIDTIICEDTPLSGVEAKRPMLIVLGDPTSRFGLPPSGHGRAGGAAPGLAV